MQQSFELRRASSQNYFQRCEAMLVPAASLAMLQACIGKQSLAWRLTAWLAYGLLVLSQLQLIIPLNDIFHLIGAQPLAALLLLPVFAFWPSSEGQPMVNQPCLDTANLEDESSHSSR